MTYAELVGSKAKCPNCGTLNTIPDYVAAPATSRTGFAGGPVTLDCFACGERENLGEWAVSGIPLADLL